MFEQELQVLGAYGVWPYILLILAMTVFFYFTLTSIARCIQAVEGKPLLEINYPNKEEAPPKQEEKEAKT
jgi:hypothetical protein